MEHKNIDTIYAEQKPYLERKFADLYNSFAKDIETDCDYNLSDDETSELFNELVIKYMHDTMIDYEFVRVFNSVMGYTK